MTETEIEKDHLDVPGAALAYDVRPVRDSDLTPLLVMGSPMGAAGFGTLAGHFTDRTVITYDPRGVERSSKDDPSTESTPDEHADDLHRLIETVGGPVDIMASSGGAVNALALVSRYPDDVRTLVAHEPPLAGLVPDREQALAACQQIRRLYDAEGLGAAMVRFILLVSHEGPVPDGFTDTPAPDPQTFGLPEEDDGSRADVLLGQNLLTCTHYEPDLDALRASTARLVLAVGAGSERQLACRATRGLAERLGTGVTVFPGDHAGFLGGEYGQTGEPEAFAATLRGVLDDQDAGSSASAATAAS